MYEKTKIIIIVILIIIIAAIGRILVDADKRIDEWKTNYDKCNGNLQTLQSELNKINGELWKIKSRSSL